MNWHHALTEKIRDTKAFSFEQREALVLCANELAVVCDQVAQGAPEPELLCTMGRLLLSWGNEKTWLAFGVHLTGAPVLSMCDKGVMHRIDTPPHDELRRAVLAFFEAQKS